MQRYFVKKDQIRDQSITIVGDDVHHIKRVMRLRKGKKIICVDGSGQDYLVQIEAITTHEVIGRILDVTPSKGETKIEITLAQALPKGDKWEWVLQKGTELGVTHFIPFFSERTIVKIKSEKANQKQLRWHRIVKEAAEQAERAKIPDVHVPITWESFLSEIEKRKHVVIAYEKGGEPLRTQLRPIGDWKEVMLVVGPEGGFSTQEIEEATNAGAVPVSLGSRILRTETASIVGLSCILFASNELGG